MVYDLCFTLYGYCSWFLGDCLEFVVCGLRFAVHGSGKGWWCRVESLRSRSWGVGYRGQGLKCRVYIGYRVQP